MTMLTKLLKICHNKKKLKLLKDKTLIKIGGVVRGFSSVGLERRSYTSKVTGSSPVFRIISNNDWIRKHNYY